jgi:hypothetical protein
MILADPSLWAREKNAADAVNALLARGEQLVKENQVRAAKVWPYAQIFEGLTLNVPSAADRRTRNPAPLIEKPIIRNRVRSLVQTWVSKVTAGDSPLPQFMTTDADWDVRRKAVMWDRAVEAEIDQPQGAFADMHELWRHAATVCTVVGSVAVYFGLAADMRPCAEVSDTLDLGVDVATPHAAPYSVVWRRRLGLIEAKALYPDHAEALEAVAEASDGTGSTEQSFGENALYGRQERRVFVVVTCGWSCKQGEETGRHMAVLRDGTVLVDADYDREEVPFVFYHFERELFGQWGVPMVQTFYHSAVRENEMLNDVHHAERSTPQVYVFAHESQLAAGGLDEAKGVSLVPLSDAGLANPPGFVAPPKFNRQSLELIQLEATSIQEISGVSEAHSSGRKQAGTTSGRHEALVAALFTERFADHERRLIRARTVSTARQLVWRLQDAIDAGFEYERAYVKNGKRAKITAEDLDFELGFEISIKPVSEDKTSPSARMKQLEEWFQAGLITGGELLAGQQHLDSIAVSELATEQEHWIRDQVERWLYSSNPVAEYQSPVRWLDLPTALKQVSNSYLKARSDGAPSDRLELFENFMAECQIYVDQEKAAAQPPPPPTPTQPSGPFSQPSLPLPQAGTVPAA